MTYAVLLRIDPASTCPVIVPEDSPPLQADKAVRYRFVAQTDDHGEAVQVLELLHRRLEEQAGVA